MPPPNHGRTVVLSPRPSGSWSPISKSRLPGPKQKGQPHPLSPTPDSPRFFL